MKIKRKANKKDLKQAEYIFSMGNEYEKQGKIDDAINCYQRVIKLTPKFAEAYHNLGNVLIKKERIDEAMTCYKKAIELTPNIAETYNNLGNVLQDKGHLDEAIACYQKALSLNPNFTGAYYNLGDVLQDKGQLDEAIICYQRAIELDPQFAYAYNNLATALKAKGQIAEAIIYCKKAIEIDPNLVNAFCNLGSALQDKGQLDEAIMCYQKALQHDSNHIGAYTNLGYVFQNRGQHDKGEMYFRHALKIKPNDLIAYQCLLMGMNYNPNYNAQTIFSEHLRFAKQHAEPLYSTALTHTNDYSPARRLKIGYVSPDFRRHPVACFIEPVLASHNREYFEVFCYSNSLFIDEVTRRIQKYSDQWRTIVGMSDDNTATLIRNDKIDILIDLAGHTAANRILVFARKPAPIQISWIGYLATTGLSTIDYKIVDGYTDPIGKTEQFYTEKLIRLPESFLCYLPDRDSPEVGPLPALSTGHITFGSFNNFVKVTPEVFTLWARVLNELPESRLILKGKNFNDRTTYQYAIKMFTQRGISAERIILQTWDPSPKHLESYNQIDIGLDTFPFNGATTTCEAMWMGVPVITLAGTAYHSSVGKSLLSNVGLDKFIAKTNEEYIQIAIDLSSDLNKLQLLRKELRDMMANSTLTNAKRFTINLEKSYREIWEKWCKHK